MTDIVFKLLRATIWSSFAVLFESEQTSGKSSISICCFAQDSIQNMLLCSYVIFQVLLRDQWLIERLSEPMGAGLVGNDFSPSSIENFISHEKKDDL